MATAEEELRCHGEQGNLPWTSAHRATQDRWLYWEAALWDWRPRGCCRKRDSESRFTRKICRPTQRQISRAVNGFRFWCRILKNGRLTSINNFLPQRSSPTGGTRLWWGPILAFAGCATTSSTISLGTNKRMVERRARCAP